MPRFRSRLALAAIGLPLALALPGAAGAGNRIPVSSVDDPTGPTANRIAAVTEIVKPTNARLVRVINAYPPNPCADLLEPTALCDNSEEVVSAYEALRQSVVEACDGRTAEGTGDTVVADADAYAGDTSMSGIANQLASIATVLGNADDRLRGIEMPNPGPPNTAEINGALNALAEAIDFGVTAATTWEVPEVEFPPNPVCPA